MSFGNSYQRILAGSSPSHMWIELHRLVEAYCRTAGRPFTAVFAELEELFRFSRTVRARWPDVPTMRAAAEHLHGLRDAILAERRAWIAERRRTKRFARASSPPAHLRDAEARARAHAAERPQVGCWGWRLRRERRR